MSDSNALGSTSSAQSTSTTTTKNDTSQTPAVNDFWDVISGVLKAVPYKMAILIYMIFIVINSTIFIEYTIEPLGSSYYGSAGLTNSGTYLQGLFLVIGYLAVYILLANEVV